MRRENAGCVTWRNSAERLKLRVSASETKSSSHFSSMRGLLPGGREEVSILVGVVKRAVATVRADA